MSVEVRCQVAAACQGRGVLQLAERCLQGGVSWQDQWLRQPVHQGPTGCSVQGCIVCPRHVHCVHAS